MIRVEIATAGDCEEVLPLFEGFRNPKITEEQWRSLFHYTWPAPTDARGFILRDGKRAVGFFGTVWSERTVDGRIERICNLSSWITLPEYRNHSLLLFKEVAALRDCTITCHSPAPQLYPLYKRFGFRDLETKLRILLPRPAWQGVGTWLGDRALSDPDEIAPLLNESDRAILEAHRIHRCGHLLLLGNTDACYLIFTKTKGKRFHFAHVHYLSNGTVFARNLDRVRLHLLLSTGTPLVMIDARLVAELKFPHSREVALGVPHIFRSETLAPEQVDNLYSELILLGL